MSDMSETKKSKYKLRELKGDSFLDHLLHYRGIKSESEKVAFLSPSYDTGVHDPFLLKDMRKVVDRIMLAVETGEKICIYSDFDADGIPGAVVLHDFFKKISYDNFVNYIPDRHMEGFGIHRKALEQIIAEGSTLIISIDCGIAEVENSKWVKELATDSSAGADTGADADGKARGVDLIITDHHTPGAELPDAFAIINPKQSDCQYPEKMLCGSGVIFKVVQALCIECRARADGAKGEESAKDASDTKTTLESIAAEKEKNSINYAITPGWEKWLLDMVGLATLSDMVPLLGENRVFAYFGLTVLRKTPRLGLQKLFKSLKMNPAYLTEEDIAFMITPRINAASRMASPMDAFRLLATTDNEEADRLVEHLNNLNTERKTRVALLAKAIKKSIEERGLVDKGVLVVGNPDWQPPVLGLVATSIVRDYGKPVFLWGRDESGVIKGSCRAPDGFDVVKIMRAVPEGTFINLGGHVAAGGYSIVSEKIHEFEQVILKAHEELVGGSGGESSSELAGALNGEASGVLDEASVDDKGEILILGQINIDKVLDPSEVGRILWADIEKVGPFGEANPKPIFILKDVKVIDVKIFGKTKEHIEIKVENVLTGAQTKAIKFFAAEDAGLMERLRVGELADVVVHMEKSMFRNFPEYRLRIVEVV